MVNKLVISFFKQIRVATSWLVYFYRQSQLKLHRRSEVWGEATLCTLLTRYTLGAFCNFYMLYTVYTLYTSFTDGKTEISAPQ